MSEPERTSNLDSLYRELYPSLVRFSQGIVGSRPDAEDAVHDAFVAAARSEPAKDARPWLFRVTRNASIDLLRRRRNTVELDQVQESLPGGSGIEPHASAELNEKLALMRAALDALPERGRTALLLRELAGLPYPEIGQVLDTTEGNVKVLIFRARASLHEYTEAAELECTSVRTALSAAADGEAGRLARTSARLHSAHCKRCRDFGRSIGSQKAAIGALIPLVAAPHSLGLVAGGAVSSGVAGAKMAGAKVAVGAALAAATIGVSAGGVAVWSGMHPHHPPEREAMGTPTPASPAAAAGSGRDDRQEPSAHESAAGDDDSTAAGGWPVAHQDTASSTSGSSGEAEAVALWTTTPAAPAPSEPADRSSAASGTGASARTGTAEHETDGSRSGHPDN